jgi:tetratricopeptide (TPR) repeat protein
MAPALDRSATGKRRTGGTDSVAAYDAYLRGRAFYDISSGEESDRAALAQFEAAIKIDPNYAAAFAARARTLAVIANGTDDAGELRSLYDTSLAAAKQAVKLAPEFADAYSALGYALVYGKQDVRAARAPYEKSRVLGWGDADVLIRYALFCAQIGRAPDAANAIRRAAELDPLNPRVFRTTGMIDFQARRYRESIVATQKALSLNPKMSGANAAIGAAFYMLGNIEEARTAFMAESYELTRLPGIAITARKLGQLEPAQKALAEIEANFGDNGLYQRAQVLAQWGRQDAALAALERGHRIGDAGLLFMRSDPLLDPLRNDPRFSRLLNDIGFD